MSFILRIIRASLVFVVACMIFDLVRHRPVTVLNGERAVALAALILAMAADRMRDRKPGN